MISRIDQAVLLLQDRLQKLAKQGGAKAGPATSGQAVDSDPIEKLRDLRKRSQLGRDELGRALVRSLLADSLGATLAGSLDFQAVADQVSIILYQSEEGHALVDQAMTELGLD
ncbi:hypothetical protein [Telmatospirillum sp.]|uniref:hypothetical protein n=1 Tax=Telmatospirillum sp. TaxID=2079197 RepID=UPI00284AA80C|nr:hypothetical protein [Telmatospirillum sp.]MDR3438077.1 hypothetical protein [Telmatospirillum sp.]